MRGQKTRSAKLNVGKTMPPLYHKIPGELYSSDKSEVLQWIAKQPALLEWLFAQLKSAGYVEYDGNTGLWSGVEDWE